MRDPTLYYVCGDCASLTNCAKVNENDEPRCNNCMSTNVFQVKYPAAKRVQHALESSHSKQVKLKHDTVCVMW